MNEKNLNFLRDSAKLLDIDLTEKQLEAFSQYLTLLVEWNQKFNLTAITDEKEIVIKHFVDSFSIVSFLRNTGMPADIKKNSQMNFQTNFQSDTPVDFLSAPQSTETLSLLDIGAGAGFPGIPLKILFREQLKVTLMDSVAKKVTFMDEVIRSLYLADCIALHARAEDLARQNEHREQYRFVTARALASLPVLVEYGLPFLKIGGYLIAMKAGREGAEEEVQQSQKVLAVMGGKISSIKTFSLPQTDLTRTIILIQKIAVTPAQYPRKAGLPSKKPLI